MSFQEVPWVLGRSQTGKILIIHKENPGKYCLMMMGSTPLTRRLKVEICVKSINRKGPKLGKCSLNIRKTLGKYCLIYDDGQHSPY